MYKALYRKYRPQVFSDVVGQDHVTATLRNEIVTGRHTHAYLFCGSRGTGKTTCAKIFAKAVNCEHPVDGDPCNECASCRGIDDGSILDVIEIDAASNNGVDNIRDIRDQVNFTPVNVKYRVYIIDEVHMLSTGAFNALLKTLEEPPEHVKFILATTEVHKLPATILSRCQRFDFRRISADDITKRLEYVASCENIDLQHDAALLIARLADGALRDALSILDQCISTGKTVDTALVNETAGLADKEYLYKMASYIGAGDSASALALSASLYERSCDMERLMQELISFFRDLMIIKSVDDPSGLIICTSDEMKKYRECAGMFSVQRVLSALDILSDSLAAMRAGMTPRVEAEMTLIRLCRDVSGKASGMIGTAASTSFEDRAAVKAPQEKPYVPDTDKAPAVQKTPEEIKPAAPASLADAVALTDKGAGALLSDCKAVADGDTLTVYLPTDFKLSMFKDPYSLRCKAVSKAAGKIYGHAMKITYLLAKSSDVTAAAEPEAPVSAAADDGKAAETEAQKQPETKAPDEDPLDMFADKFRDSDYYTEE